MAKSIRSKRRQRMRNEKRKKTAPKELARLLKCVGQEVKVGKDVEMKELVTVKDRKEVVEESKEAMEVAAASKHHKKTLLDENGHYPEWVGKKQMKKLQANRKAAKNKKNGKGRKGIKW